MLNTIISPVIQTTDNHRKVVVLHDTVFLCVIQTYTKYVTEKHSNTINFQELAKYVTEEHSNTINFQELANM
jgi:hypothetical protein